MRRKFDLTFMIRTLFDNPVVPEDRKIIIDANDPSCAFTHGQLKAQSLKIAAGLQHYFGLKKGQVVAVIAPDDLEIMSIILGILSAGGVMTAERDFSNEAVLRNFILRIDAQYIVAHPSALDKVLRITQELGIPARNIVILGHRTLEDIPTYYEALIRPDYTFLHVDINPDDPALFIHTSGSSGIKKTVIVNHKALMFEKDIAHKISTGVHDKGPVLTHLFLLNSAALSIVMFQGLWRGRSIYILKSQDLECLCDCIQAYKISTVFIVPSVTGHLACDPLVDKYDLSSLLFIHTIGSFLAPTIPLEVEKRTGAKVINKYGLTEIKNVFTADADSTLIGSVGVPIEGIQVKLITSNGQEAKVGDIGELLVKAPNASPGYYKNPEATLKAIDKEGFFHTGDMFQQDSDGRYTMLGRMTEVIRSSCYPFYPSQVESAMIKHPSVVNCAVVGVTCQKDDVEVARAYVELSNNEGLSESTIADELAAFCDAQLPCNMKLYGGVFIVKTLPKTPTGKLDRITLRHMTQQMAPIELSQENIISALAV